MEKKKNRIKLKHGNTHNLAFYNSKFFKKLEDTLRKKIRKYFVLPM